MSMHANFHNVTGWETDRPELIGGTKDCPHTFWSRRIIIHADGVRHEFNLFADKAEALALPSETARHLQAAE